MKATAYVGVSTDEHASRGVSLDTQRAKLEQYAQIYDLEPVPAEQAVIAHDAHSKRRGRPPSDDPTKTVTVRLHGSTLAELEEILADRQQKQPDLTMRALLREIIETWVKLKERKAGK